MRREGRKGKYRGEEMVLLLCQGMPLTEIEGYCFYTHELFWSWRLKDDGAARVVNILASLLFFFFINATRCTAVCCQFLLFAVNYVLKVALRRGMLEQLSVKQLCERVKVCQLLGDRYRASVITPTKPNSFSSEIDNS